MTTLPDATAAAQGAEALIHGRRSVPPKWLAQRPRCLVSFGAIIGAKRGRARPPVARCVGTRELRP